MKKAVISTGGKQYIVSEGDELDVEIIDTDKKNVEFDALLVYGGDKVDIGAPVLSSVKITADIVEQNIAQNKVTSIRYKPKKRIRKIKGHRQTKTKIKIKSIK